MAVSTRPTTLTANHNYNLRNQGWPKAFDCAPNVTGDGGAISRDPVAYTRSELGVYPSNSDVMWQCKLTTSEDIGPLGTYSPWHLQRFSFGNTPAAKGHFIINAFNRDRETASGISGIYKTWRDKTEDRPVAVEFYSGRIWYLMPSGELYFSQVLTELDNARRCYQEADPTAEDINELVATDGGYIDISGIAEALNLIPVRADLAILADNGVWSISGSSDAGFTATDQELRKITSVGAIGAETVVEAEGTIFYWSEGGIYALTENEVSGLLEATNITENTIQTFYVGLSDISKINARAYYDKQTKKIFWFYNSDPAFDGINFRFKYNSALIYDLVLGAFYTYSWTADDPYPWVVAMVQKKAGSYNTEIVNVTNNGVIVTDGGDNVTSQTTTYNSSDIKLKLLTLTETADDVYRYTFSEFSNNTLLDWATCDGTGVDFTSYLETGHDLGEDLLSEKEAGPLFCFFNKTETAFVENSDGDLVFDYPSGCQMRAKWHWADSESSGRWSEPQQVYRLQQYYVPTGAADFDYGLDVIQTVTQLRGKGRALSLRFESESGKDFQLLGWALPMTYLTGV